MKLKFRVLWCSMFAFILIPIEIWFFTIQIENSFKASLSAFNLVILNLVILVLLSYAAECLLKKLISRK